MAKLSSDEECAKMVLEIFNRKKSRDGDCLSIGNFMAVWSEIRWDERDLDRGLQYAISQGWVQKNSQGLYCLTKVGFDEM